MSTTARKARKRATNLLRQVGLPTTGWTKAPKMPTPVTERTHLQPRPIHGKGPNAASTRYGYTKPAIRELRARGIEVNTEPVG